ncbi:MAG: sigma-70 family RNA polymerase sigma factor [Chitinophagaceae bacterium]|nr:sigma-70 family RNA polymerase sigma factor [Chitinophagaceae bacterium]
MTVEEIENILLLISYKEEDEDSAKAGFTDLYHGYSKFLSSVISRALKDRGIYDEQILNTVISNTFYKLYKNPLLFSFKNGTKNDNAFKAWLSKVAKNELKRLIVEYYRERETSSLELLGNESAIESDELADEICRNVNFKILDNALQLLSERDKHILLTLYLYYEEGKNTPSAVLKLLCKMYDTTTANIRKVKERGEKKIVEYFSKNTQLKPIKHVK